MKVTVNKKDKVLTIEIPLNAVPKPSGSGKNLVIASTGGNTKTTAEFDGKNIVVGLNAYIPA